jgi:hypothetical protein
MNPVSERNLGHIVSQIDIQLWAREQRRRWLAHRITGPLSRGARGLAQAMLRATCLLLANAGTALLLTALAKRSASR